MATDFKPSKQLIRSCLLYDFKSGLKAVESIRRINAAFGEGTVSRTTAYDWFDRFRGGDYSLEDQPRSGRPSELDDDELRAAVEDDPHITTRELAELLDVSHQTVSSHLQAIGKVSKIDQWVPHELTDFDRKRRLDAATTLLSFRRTNNWLKSIVTGDEKWCLYVNMKRRRSWVNKGAPPQKMPKPERHQEKVMLSVWWDHIGVIHYELLEKNTTITAALYCNQLDRVAEKLERVRPGHGQVRYLHDNARPHVANTTRQKLLDLQWEVLPHPPYSPDIAPTDYHLFNSLSSAMTDIEFENEAELDLWIHDFFSSKPHEFYSDGIQKLPEKWQKVIENDGDYFD